MKSKTHSISKIINSDSEILFKIVSEFENYSNWNTIIPNAEGKLVKGAVLRLVIKMNGKSRPFNPTVKLIEMNKSFLLSKVFLSKRIGELTHKFEFVTIQPKSAGLSTIVVKQLISIYGYLNKAIL